jgi:uncharacterized membrane protein YccC
MAARVLMTLVVLVLTAVIAATALGAHRRGRSNVVAVICGLVFPFTWLAWYLIDERPYSR